MHGSFPNIFIDNPQTKIQSQSHSNPKGKEEFGLWAVTKILWATHPPHHPLTFRGYGWECMVQIGAPSTSEYWEGVPNPGGQREEKDRVVLHIQVKHIFRRSPKTIKKSPKFLGLSLSTTSLVVMLLSSCPNENA